MLQEESSQPDSQLNSSRQSRQSISGSHIMKNVPVNLNIQTQDASGMAAILAGGILNQTQNKNSKENGEPANQNTKPQATTLKDQRAIFQESGTKSIVLTKSLIAKIGDKEIVLQAGEFKVGNRIIKRVPKALFCLTHTNPVRKVAAIVSEHRAFDTFIIVLIFANMITMASRDYLHKNIESVRNNILDQMDYAFSLVFLIESILKTLTSGFVLGEKTYLRDPWNVMDFMIVVSAIVDFFLVVILGLSGEALGALKVIRVLRVLKPLKAVKTMRSLRLQVAALIKSLKQLANVMAFLLAMFILGGVMGLQLFMKSVHYACRTTPEPLPGAETWERAGNQICSQNGDNSWISYKGHACEEGTFCGSPIDYGLEPDEEIKYDMTVQYGFGIFRDFGDSIFTVFQMITMDNWSQIIYNISAHEGFWLPSIFGIFLVFLGSFFLLNLMLAVIMDSYDQTSNSMDELQHQQLEQEKKEIEDRIARTASMNTYSELNDLLMKKQEQMKDIFRQKFRDRIFGSLEQDKNEQPNEQQQVLLEEDSSPSSSEESVKIQIQAEKSEDSSKSDELDREILDDQSEPGSKVKGLMANTLGKTLLMPSLSLVASKSEIKSGSNKSNSVENRSKRGSDTSSVNKHQSFSQSVFKSRNQSKAVQESDEQKLKRIETSNSKQLIENLHFDTKISASSKGMSLMDRIGKSLISQVHNKQKDIDDLKKRAEKIEQPEAQSAITGITSRTIAAVNLHSLQDKYTASDQIRLEGNLMMLKFQDAFKEKYISKRGLHSYGLKDEGNTMSMLRGQITSSLASYKKSIVHSKSKSLPQLKKAESEPVAHKSTNPLAAVFAAAKRKKELEQEEEDKQKPALELDDDVQRGLTMGKVGPMQQIKLVMQIKQNADKQLAEKQILAKMAHHFKNIVVEQDEMQNIINETDALLDLDICEMRAKQNFFYRRCFEMQQSRFFVAFISFCIVTNTIVLGLDSYPVDIEMLIFIEWANFIFFLIFIGEMVIKMLGLGLKIYFKDSANFFDFVVIIFSTIDFILQMASGGIDVNKVKALQAMRVFRLLRVFKLAKIWPEFAYILETMGRTVRKISAFAVLLLIFIFIYALLGLELFSAKLSFDHEGKPVLDDYSNGVEGMQGNFPDSTFNTFWESIVSVFIVLANDGWSTIYFDHARIYREEGQSVILPMIYFISLIIIGQNILFQLFLAILLQEFDERSLVAEEKKKNDAAKNPQNQQSMLSKVSKKLKSKCCKKRASTDEDSKDADGQDDRSGLRNDSQIDLMQNSEAVPRQPDESAINDDQQGGGRAGDDSVSAASNNNIATNNEVTERKGNRSLFIFSEHNKLRKLAIRTEESNYFKNSILILILISSVLLAIENPLTDPNSSEALVLMILDSILTVAFTVEIIIKVVANGFIANGKDSYMKHFWNVLDFFIVIIAITSLTFEGYVDLAALKILRMGRLFRPLRVLSRNEGLRISIQALIVSVPAMLRLLMIVALFFIIFAIMGINLFKGIFQQCDTSGAVRLSPDQQETEITDEQTCLDYGGEWNAYYKNFDTLPEAMKQMVSMSQTVGWAEFMYRAIRSRGEGKQPDRSGETADPIAAAYFCIFIVFGAFFITNLFVGVVISTYNREKDRLGNNFLLSDDQKRYIETKLLVIRIHPKRINLRPGNKCRSFMFSISEHKYFDYGILLCISMNALLMCINHVGIDQGLVDLIAMINRGFTLIFFIEMVIRLFAYGLNYFKDGWFVFDFVIVVGSSILFLASIGGDGDDLKVTEAVTAARLLRIFRLLRLFRKLKSLQGIFSTFLSTLPHMLNVGGIMLLIVYIYAVLGINLFADVMPVAGGILDNNKFLGFSHVYKSFVTLIRIATGENWNQLMDELSQTQSPSHSCIESPTYQEFLDNGQNPVGCGKMRLASIFFLSYIVIVGLVFLNLFIAIILQGYYQTQEMEKQVVNTQIMNKYKDCWAQLDPHATGFIPSKKFGDLMLAFGPPLGWDESFRDKSTKQALFFKMITMNMKSYSQGQYIQFSDVLDAITMFHIIRSEVRAEMEEEGVAFLSDEEVEEDVDDGDGISKQNGSAQDNGDPKQDDESSSSDDDDSDGDKRSKPKIGVQAENCEQSDHKVPGLGQALAGMLMVKSNSNKGKAPLSKITVNKMDTIRTDGPRPAQEKSKKKKKLTLLEEKMAMKQQEIAQMENIEQSSLVKNLIQKKKSVDKKSKKNKLFQQDSMGGDKLTSIMLSLSGNQQTLSEDQTLGEHSSAVDQQDKSQEPSQTSSHQFLNPLQDQKKRFGTERNIDVTVKTNQHQSSSDPSKFETSSFQTDFNQTVQSHDNANAPELSHLTSGPQLKQSITNLEKELNEIESMNRKKVVSSASSSSMPTIGIEHRQTILAAQVDVIDEEDELMEEELNKINLEHEEKNGAMAGEMRAQQTIVERSNDTKKLGFKNLGDRSMSDVMQSLGNKNFSAQADNLLEERDLVEEEIQRMDRLISQQEEEKKEEEDVNNDVVQVDQQQSVMAEQQRQTIKDKKIYKSDEKVDAVQFESD